MSVTNILDRLVTDLDAEMGACGNYDVETLRKALQDVAAAERKRIYDALGHNHYVIFTEDRWTVEHSVECRLSGRMHECDHHAAVARIAHQFSPDMAGRWLITAIDGNGEPALVRDDLLAGPSATNPGGTT